MAYRSVAESVIGRFIRRIEVVHHNDFDHSNDSPDNLLVVTKWDHHRIHAGKLLPDLRLDWAAPEGRSCHDPFPGIEFCEGPGTHYMPDQGFTPSRPQLWKKKISM